MIDTARVHHDRRSVLPIPGCVDCIRKSSCPGFKLSRSPQESQSGRLQHSRPVHRGQCLLSPGKVEDGVFLVRAGSFKSFSIDAQGEIQLIGFHLPGDILGTEGFFQGSHNHFVQALETSSVCKVPLNLLYVTRNRQGRPETPLLRLMGETLVRDRSKFLLMSRMTAQRRVAFFLVDLEERMRPTEAELTRITLSMCRADIANYLGLAIETVSRLFTQLQSKGLIRVHRRELELRDLDGLRVVAGDSLVQPPALDKAG